MRQLELNVLREEYLAVTGDTLLALLVNYFVFKTKRQDDIDKYLQEEAEYHVILAKGTGDDSFNHSARVLHGSMSHGWIRKGAGTIAKESLITVSDTTMRSYLNQLKEMGIVDHRFDPKNPFDRVPEWRVNMVKLNAMVQEHGYAGIPDFYFGPAAAPSASRGFRDSTLAESATVQSKNGETFNMLSGAKAPAIQKEATGKRKRATAKADKPKKEPKQSDPNLKHPAVMKYREIACVTPNVVARQAIVAKFTVPNETMLSEWEKTIRDWIGRGWNKTNITGMLEYHDKLNPPVVKRRFLGEGVTVPEGKIVAQALPSTLNGIGKPGQMVRPVVEIGNPATKRWTPPVEEVAELIHDCPM